MINKAVQLTNRTAAAIRKADALPTVLPGGKMRKGKISVSVSSNALFTASVADDTLTIQATATGAAIFGSFSWETPTTSGSFSVIARPNPAKTGAWSGTTPMPLNATFDNPHLICNDAAGENPDTSEAGIEFTVPTRYSATAVFVELAQIVDGAISWQLTPWEAAAKWQAAVKAAQAANSLYSTTTTAALHPLLGKDPTITPITLAAYLYRADGSVNSSIDTSAADFAVSGTGTKIFTVWLDNDFDQHAYKWTDAANDSNVLAALFGVKYSGGYIYEIQTYSQGIYRFNSPAEITP